MAKDLHGLEWRFRHIYRGVSLVNILVCIACLFDTFELGVLSFIIMQMNRPATEAFANYWMECICEQKEACFWRCCVVS